MPDAERPAPAPTPASAALTAEPLLPWLEKWKEHFDEYFFQLSHMGDCQQFAQAVHSRLPEIIATLRSQAAEIERLRTNNSSLRGDLDRLTDAECTPLAVELAERADKLKTDRDRLRAELAACRAALDRGRLGCASVLRDLASRVGIVCTPQYVKERLEEIANQWEFWATSAPPPEKP